MPPFDKCKFDMNAYYSSSYKPTLKKRTVYYNQNETFDMLKDRIVQWMNNDV